MGIGSHLDDSAGFEEPLIDLAGLPEIERFQVLPASGSLPRRCRGLGLAAAGPEDGTFVHRVEVVSQARTYGTRARAAESGGGGAGKRLALARVAQVDEALSGDEKSAGL